MSNPNYTGNVAFVAEKSIKRKAQQIWHGAAPLFTMTFEKKKNFNQGFRIEGLKAIIPINFAEASSAANGVSDANELTPATPYGTSGFTQAEYEFTHYRHPMYIKDSEEKLITGPGVRTNFLEAKTTQLVESFRKAASEDQVSANAGTREAVLGLRYICSTLNSPGNISQATYPVWAAGYTGSAGPWYEGLISNQYDRMVALGRGRPDMCLLSYTSTNNVYGKMRDSVNASQLLTTQGGLAKYGYAVFEYLEMQCVQEPKLGTADPGSACVVNSDHVYVGALSDHPVRKHDTPLEGTDADEMMYNWWMFWGTNDPAAGFGYVAGIE